MSEQITGAALVERIKAGMHEEGMEPDSREIELLTLAADLQDRIVELEAEIAETGLASKSAGGVVRLHPGVAEARQTRAALGRVLSSIQFPEGADEPVKKVNLAAQRAAQSRWRAHNIAKKGNNGG